MGRMNSDKALACVNKRGKLAFYHEFEAVWVDMLVRMFRRRARRLW